MQIEGLSVYALEKTLDGSVYNPLTRWTRKTAVIVRVHAEDGARGLGECWLYGTELDSLVAHLKADIGPRLIGRDAFATEGLWDDIWADTVLSARWGLTACALSGVDMALWDLKARVLGLPLYRLLGAARERVPVYASGGLYGDDKGVDELAEEMTGYTARGFRAVKMKVGALSLDEDAARVQAVREAIGRETRLMVDAVYTQSVRQARRLAARLAPLDIHWLQAPVWATDVDGMARVNRDGLVPVAGVEAECRPEAFRRLITEGAVSYLQCAVTACGGITRALRLIDLAAAWHLPSTLQCASTAIATAASLHLAAARRGVESVEVHMFHRLLNAHLPDGTLAPVDGALPPPPGAGLGLDVPDSALTAVCRVGGGTAA